MLVVEPDGHDQVEEVVAGALDQTGPERTDEPQIDRRLFDGRHAGFEELRD